MLQKEEKTSSESVSRYSVIALLEWILTLTEQESYS